MTRSRKRKLARMGERAHPIAWTGLPLASMLLGGSGTLHAADSVVLQEVVVTAQKRSEDLQRVPISLQVLSSESLEQRQVSSFDDYAKLLTSVSFQSFGPSQAQLYFRGIASGADGLHAGSLPATGVYLDEIPVTTIGNSLDIHMYDIERVEALAGPQGTLYGASSLSGTLRIITNKPDPSGFSAAYDVKADKFARGNGGGEFDGYVNIPIAARATVRLVGYYEHDGGYINNVYSQVTLLRGSPPNGIPNDPATYTDFVAPRDNSVDTYGGRAALKIDLDDQWTITPQVLGQRQQANGNFAVDPADGDLNVADFTKGLNEDRWYQSALTVEGKMANFDLLYSGGWLERSVLNTIDYSGYTIGYDHLQQLPGYTSGTYDRFFDSATGQLTDPIQFDDSLDRYTKMTHELRVTTSRNRVYHGIVGAFYQRQTDNARSAAEAPDLPSYYAVDGQPNTIYLSQLTRVDRDYALFTDWSLDLTRKWQIAAGIRRFWVDNTLLGFTGVNSGPNGEGACNPPVSPATIIPGLWPCINVAKKAIENGETHRVTVTYQIDPDLMTYSTYSTGFRPGGINRRSIVLPYRPDTLTNFEAGWKTTWLGRVRWNGALFFERWKGVQLPVIGPYGISSIVNVGNAISKGIESEITWLALDDLTVSASGTYVNARTTDEFCNVDQQTELITHDCANPTAPAGTPLPVTPRLKATGTVRYTFNAGRYASFVQASANHQSSATSNLSLQLDKESGNLPAFTSFDFSAGTGLGNWRLEAYIENAFDERGQLDRIAECANVECYRGYHVYLIKPMSFGIKFGQSF